MNTSNLYELRQQKSFSYFVFAMKAGFDIESYSVYVHTDRMSLQQLGGYVRPICFQDALFLF